MAEQPGLATCSPQEPPATWFQAQICSNSALWCHLTGAGTANIYPPYAFDRSDPGLVNADYQIVMEVQQIMSRPALVAEPESSLDDLIQMMETASVRHLPVVAGDRFLGLVTDRALLEATGWLPERIRETFEGTSKRPRNASDLLVSPIMTARPTDDVMTLTVESVTQGIGCLPILSGHELMGILTQVDLMRAFRNGCSNREVGEDRDTTVDRLMTRSVRALDVRGTLGDVMDIFADTFFRHLPVVQAGHLVGLISDRDIRRELGRCRRRNFPVSEMMTPDPTTVRPRTLLSDAVQVMINERVDSVPVIQCSEIVGILTCRDVLDYCMNHLPRPSSILC